MLASPPEAAGRAPATGSIRCRCTVVAATADNQGGVMEPYQEQLIELVKGGRSAQAQELCRALKVKLDLSGADLRKADLTGARLTEADLSRANLNEADLTDANLTAANLSGTNLSWANLSWANLTKADLGGAKLTDVKHDGDTRWPAGFAPPPSR